MPTKSKLWYLSNINLFKGMSPEEMKWLEQKTTMKHYKKGESIFPTSDDEDRVYFLKEGLVKLSKFSSSGQELMVDILRPGNILGEISLGLDNESPSFTETYAQAMAETTLCIMPESDFEELLRMKPNLSIKLVKLMGLRLRTVEAKFCDLVFKSVKERLSALLVKLAEEYGQESNDGLRIGIKLTHQDLANLIGSTRETTSLTLNELKREGAIDLAGRKILIKSSSLLNQISSQV